MSRPSHHVNSSRTLFQNPWKTPEEPDENATEPASPARSNSESVESSSQVAGSSSFFHWISNGIPSLLMNIPLELARDLSHHKIMPKKIVEPQFFKHGADNRSLKATWLGHASYLLEMKKPDDAHLPIRLLFDPIFSDRAGPSAWTGVKRRLPPPCSVVDLPDYQFVLISHNHYDHLDFPSIQEILRVRGSRVTFLVPLGLKRWMIDSGVHENRIIEMDWWDEVSLPATEVGAPVATLNFVCVPAQHTSGRSIGDKRATLWCGWVIKQGDTRVYYAGDTGYTGSTGPTPVFTEIGKRCGPFDLSFIPIWRGGTLSFVSQIGLRLTHHPFLSSMHASPLDAVAIHKAVRSRHTLAMHFGTFAGSETEMIEPLVELAQARENAGVGDWWEEGGIGATDIGETVLIPVDDTEDAVCCLPTRT